MTGESKGHLRTLWLEAEARARHLAERAQYASDVVRGHYCFRNVAHGRRVYVRGNLRVVPDGRLVVGERTLFLKGVVRSELITHSSGELVIGHDCGFAHGLSIEVRQSVRIGDRCICGAMVRISDFVADRVAPVVIEEDVWLAYGVIIEPGVRVGKGSVISTGSVVTKDVPPKHLAVGNPARAMPLDGFWRDRVSTEESA